MLICDSEAINYHVFLPIGIISSTLFSYKILLEIEKDKKVPAYVFAYILMNVIDDNENELLTYRRKWY